MYHRCTVKRVLQVWCTPIPTWMRDRSAYRLGTRVGIRGRGRRAGTLPRDLWRPGIGCTVGDPEGTAPIAHVPAGGWLEQWQIDRGCANNTCLFPSPQLLGLKGFQGTSDNAGMGSFLEVVLKDARARRIWCSRPHISRGILGSAALRHHRTLFSQYRNS